MKRILLPTDFSDNAWNAIIYATELYKNEECMFYILNVFRIHNYSTTGLIKAEYGNPAYDIALDESQRNIKDIIRRLSSARNTRHYFEGLSKHNFLLDALNYETKEKGIDMIIMGTKGANNAKGINYGSNTVAVMEKVISCPVLAVPGRAEFMGFREIVFPTSFEMAYKKPEINPLLNLAKEFDPNIRVLHIRENEELTETQTKNKKLLEYDLAGTKYSFHSLTNIDPATGISCFTESRNADLIALVNRKHSFLYRLTEKSVVKGISFYSKTPVLVMRFQKS